jgi:hypothetical protein
MNTKTAKNLLLISALFMVIGCNDSGGNGKGQGNGNGQSQGTNGESNETEGMPSTVTDAIDSEKSELTQDLKDSITYMFSEEKLAREVYLNVYEQQPVKQLYNIATKSEVKHEKAVNDLAVKYDLNITLYPDTEAPYDATSLASYGSGQYPVVAIQELYDMLYDKGIQSEKDALEVGCMVEVTDIDDLDKYIDQATTSNASDVLVVFNFLRDGSYKHYWSFDKGLKNKGISDGCCSLGTNYCHPEYPQE